MQQNEENEGKQTPLGKASILPEVDEATGEEVPYENHPAVGGCLQAKDEEEEQRRGQDGDKQAIDDGQVWAADHQRRCT